MQKNNTEFLISSIEYIEGYGTLSEIETIAGRAAERGVLKEWLRDFWDMVRFSRYNRIRAKEIRHDLRN